MSGLGFAGPQFCQSSRDPGFHVAPSRAPTGGDPAVDGGKVGSGSRGACEGTHKGCPYVGWREGGVRESWRVRGHTRGVPLRWMAGRWGQGVVARRGHTRGVHLRGIGGKVGSGSRGAYEGTHKGCPYGGIGRIVHSWCCGAGHPQGAPLRWDGRVEGDVVGLYA